MKKIMCAVAAVAAGVALAEVQSANIVGYSNRPLTANVQEMTSGDFVGISNQGFNLDDLRFEGENVVDSMIWWQLPSGAFQTAIWGWVFTDDEGNDLPEEDVYIGWYDAENFNPVHYVFKAGEGFFVNPGSEAQNATIVSSGALFTSDSTLPRVGVEITANVQEITSNPMPCGKMQLDDVIITGEDVVDSMIWWQLPGGAFQTAIWGWVFTDDEGNDLPEEDVYIGWYDAENFNPVHYEFKEGESFFVNPGSEATNAYLSYPNPLYVAPSVD